MPTKSVRTVHFKADYWSFEDTDDEDPKLYIHVEGRTADDKRVHIRVDDFTPFIYLELPAKVSWNRTRCQTLFQYFQSILRSEGPLEFYAQKKYILHYKHLVNTLFLTFPTQKACRSFGSKCSRNRYYIEGLGSFQPGDFQVHEQNIDPILKFTSAQSIQLAGWIEATEYIPEEDESLTEEERKFTTADIDFYAKYNEVVAYKQEDTSVVVNMRMLSFDIECNSKNHNSKIPDPTLPENKVFQIACVSAVEREPQDKWKKYLITLFDPLPIEGVEVIRCATEKELLLRFNRVINDEKPDVFLGYNIMKFDWNYLIVRATDICNIYPRFAQFSRIIGRKAEVKEVRWSSGAYGDQKFRFPDASGITNVDIMVEVERNYKLPSYGLNVVGDYFLKENKDDVTALELFMIYQMTEELLEVVKKLPVGVIERSKRVDIKKRIQNIFPLAKVHGPVAALRKELLDAKTGQQFVNLVRKGFWLTGTYCVQDTILPLKLQARLGLIVAMQETSNCMNVPMSYLHTRGQQIKVLAQVYRETIFNDIIIPFKKKSDDTAPTDERFQGAVVIEANSGDYDDVVCFDFESLYPSIMIAFNICYTTILEDSDPTPDELCHVIAWGDHVACSHDPQKRKKKKSDVLCKEHRYRFRKINILSDGTKEHEGLMPKLLRRLLSERKVKKKEMAKLDARLRMHNGKATPEDIQKYKDAKWEIIEKGSLPANEALILEICIGVLNAQQLALKVSANSIYGATGARNGFIPLIAGAASVTAMGRKLIMAAIEYVLKVVGPRKNIDTKLVYGDTDSAMMMFPGQGTAKSFELGDIISKEISHYLKCKLNGFVKIVNGEEVVNEEFSLKCPDDKRMYRIDKYPRDKMGNLSDENKIKIYSYDACPINLAFENLYKRYLLLTKKRYFAYAVNRKGEVISTTKKGIVMTRRDNCKYLRDTYEECMKGVLDRKTEKEIHYIIYDRVHKLFTRQIPDKHFVIYVGVKNVIEYAKKVEKKVGKQVVERTFVDADGCAIDDVTDPLDPRLVYRNIPQAMLALKILRRGEDIPPNTRLEFLYLESKEPTEHQGEKAEDYTFYKENKEELGLKPDFFHYIEKQLCNPLSELLRVKFPHERVPYEKLDVKFERLWMEMDTLHRDRVKNMRVFEKKITGSIYDEKTGLWSYPEYRTYTYRKQDAKIEYILDSMKKYKAKAKETPWRTEINPSKHKELYSIALTLKSFSILARMYEEHGIRKRTVRRPTKRLLIVFIKDFGDAKKGSFGKITFTSKPVSKKEEKTHTILLEDGVTLLQEVPLSAVTTWKERDSDILDDILEYRKYYRDVVLELSQIFDAPVKIVTDIESKSVRKKSRKV